MRWLYALLVTACGWGLALALQWAWRGAPGLPAAAPPWARASSPVALFLLFGLYLALTTGGRPPRPLMLLQAAIALAVAALPLAYTYGLAARFGLPASGGRLGGMLAMPMARGAAAAWLAMAVVGACRPRRRPPRAAASAARPPHAEVPLPSYWSPAPVVEPPGPSPPAIAPEGDGP